LQVIPAFGLPNKKWDLIDTVNARNSLVICDFVPLSLDKLADLLNAATGSNHTGNSLLKVGAKITELARKYNLRNGRTHNDDTLPERFFQEESLSGFMKGKKIDRKVFNNLIQEYYKLRNWNVKGEPVGM